MRYSCTALLILLALPAPSRGGRETPPEVPSGTVLPLELETGMRPARLHPGQPIRAQVMQSVPDTPVRRGDRVLGSIVGVTPTAVQLRFDAVQTREGSIPIRSSLRAIASPLEVEMAQRPEGGPDRALPPSSWTTQQIGGEQVYRGGGPVARGVDVVGKPVADGVLGRLRPSSPCRGAVAGNDRPQALWLFSTDACGVFGIPGLAIADSGRSSPEGVITLESSADGLAIPSGSGLLLRVW